jgi:hypothetical protein
LKFHVKKTHADISDFIFTPEGLGSPREVAITKKTVLKKAKFSFFSMKRGSLQKESSTPRPNTVVMVSTNKAAEDEFLLNELSDAKSLTVKRPWVLRYFSPGAVTAAATVLQPGHPLGNGVYMLPRGVSDINAAEEALRIAGSKGVNAQRRAVDILCLTDNTTGEDPAEVSAEYATVTKLGFQCYKSPTSQVALYQLLLSAKFVIVVPHKTTSQQNDRPFLEARHPRWIYDTVLCGAVPLMGPWISDAVVKFWKLFSMPVVSFSENELRSLSKQQGTSSAIFVRDKYQKYANGRSLSISPLFFPFWLDVLADISRQGPVAPASLLEDAMNTKNSRSRSAKVPEARMRARQPLSSSGKRQPLANTHNVDPLRFECSPSIWKPHPTMATKSFNVEIVVPRCCEPLESLNWLLTLLRDNIFFKATVYYRCPECLPQSTAQQWLEVINKHNNLRDKVRIAGGGLILDDIAKSDNDIQFRVRQLPLFDLKSNGKEFVPYIHHVVYNYRSLSDYTVFLHTTPHDHIKSSAIFDRSVNYLSRCKPDGTRHYGFWFVNQRMFEGSFWSNCHGCTECLYHYWASFIDSNITFAEFKDLPKRAYNAAQFIVSKKSIVERSLAWWERLLLVTNSSKQNLVKCPMPKHWNDGGNKAGLALERMWHVIFNRPPLLPFRKEDQTLPLALRIE